jgi:hypothetical protein
MRHMNQSDWASFRALQRRRQLANAGSYAPLRSDDVIEAEAAAMADDEGRVIDRANADIAQAFANAARTTEVWGAD